MRTTQHSRFLQLLTVVLGFTLLAAACGSDSDETTEVDEPDTSEPDTSTPPDAPDLAADAVVLVWTESGGCFQAAPNCARYEVTADGTVSTFRVGEDDEPIKGTIDESLVTNWTTIADGTDMDALVSRLGPGEMTAAFDGVDYVLEAPHLGVELSSVDVEFSASEEFFRAATAVASAAAAAAPLPIDMG